jgi:hypothetical protein
LEVALNSIPKTLEESYQKAFEKIDNDDRDYVTEIMMWFAVLFASLSAK